MEYIKQSTEHKPQNMNVPSRRGFTPSVEDGLAPRAFSLNTACSVFYTLISKLFPSNIRRKNARPSFTAGFTPSLENGVAVFGNIY